MMNKRYFSIFPVTPDIQTLLQYQDLLQCEFKAAASYHEDGVGDRLQGTLPVLSDVHSFVQASQCILIPPDADIMRLCAYPEYIVQAHADERELWMTALHARALNLEGQNVHELTRILDDFDPNLPPQKHYQIPVPVLVIAGAGESCDKFQTLLAAKRYFDHSGYTVTYLSANPLGMLAGMHTVPNWAMDQNLAFSYRVNVLNRYLWELYCETTPDLMIISIPGGVLCLPDDREERYAEMAHLITYAVEPDAALLNLYLDTDLSDDTLEDMEKLMLYRFGLPVYAFGIAGTVAKDTANKQVYDKIRVRPYVSAKIPEYADGGRYRVVSTDCPEHLNDVWEALLRQMQDGVHAL